MISLQIVATRVTLGRVNDSAYILSGKTDEISYFFLMISFFVSTNALPDSVIPEHLMK
jgi:hypothetical protein